MVLVRSYSRISARHVHGQAAEQVGQLRPDYLADPTLVVAVTVGVEEADGDGVGALGAYALDGSVDRVLVEGGDHLAARAHALSDLQP